MLNLGAVSRYLIGCEATIVATNQTITLAGTYVGDGSLVAYSSTRGRNVIARAGIRIRSAQRYWRRIVL